VNDDKTLEWEEFTNHIIEKGMIRKDRTFIDAIKSYLPSTIKDVEKHDTEVEYMFYIEKLRHLLVMERDSKRFKVYNAKTGKLIQHVPEKNKGSSGAVIAADYIEFGNIKFVATTSNNNAINFWDVNGYMPRERINTSDIQMCIKWCGEPYNRLYTGGVDGVIHAYDIVEMKEVSVREGVNPIKKEKIGHNAPVMALLPIPSQ
jgi:WD40 repeat protein